MLNRIISIIIPICVFLATSGCASLGSGLGSYTPVVQGKVPPADLLECGKLAKSGYMRPMGEGMMVGGAMGAAGGAAVGALVAGVSVATASGIGAAAGIPMAVWMLYNEKEKYEIGFRTCLRDRGHLVVR